MISRLDFPRPDDWHVHFRDGAMLRAVVPHTSATFARAIVMPNLTPPITDCQSARAYRDRIIGAIPSGHKFEAKMTLYMTESLQPAELARGVAEGLIFAVKLYPAGATTNSQSGVRDFGRIDPILAEMERLDLPLLVHGEVVDADIDIFDREAAFIDRVLVPIRRRFPALRLVMEHVSTKQGVEFVTSQAEGVGATITPQHLALNRNSLFAGGLRPHYYCLPVLKREEHRRALLAAVIAGDRRFFLGTDSAPHPDGGKISSCGCAGIFNSITALGCIAQLLENEGALHRLEDFVSRWGAEFYRLPCNEERMVLHRSDSPIRIPGPIVTGDGEVLTIFDPGFEIFWA